MNYKVTVLGLGAMGLPMATRLATQLTVHGFDIAEPRLRLAEAAGVRTFASAREAADGADALLLAVRNGEQLDDVLFGANGVAAVLKPGAVVILGSTVGTEAIPASDHICTACPAVAYLDLKAVLHRGHSVRQMVGSGSDLLGPAVTVAHRLLKNTVRERTGLPPSLFMTDAAATALGLSQAGISHEEEDPDVGQIHGRVVELGGADARARR